MSRRRLSFDKEKGPQKCYHNCSKENCNLCRRITVGQPEPPILTSAYCYFLDNIKDISLASHISLNEPSVILHWLLSNTQTSP